MSADKQTHMLDELQSLLEKQIMLVQRGNAAGKRFDLLRQQADLLVERIAQSEILESAEFRNRREHLKKLYDTLRLTITAQQADTSAKLNQVRTGRKTIGTYRSNILTEGKV